ncbi:MAG: hypothetical protein V7631_2657 [Massilia sp.]|jgi:hypothetical protein
MPAPLLPATLSALACYGAALLLTLMLAARLTPAAWWRRPNARALAVLVLGTGLLGSAGWWLAAPGDDAAAAFARHDEPLKPLSGRSYRVADALNLRAANGVGAARLAVLPAGSVVTATGARDGDWWQVRAEVDGAPYEGWASSLWLRRFEEGR